MLPYLFLLRHPETAYNAASRYQGQLDIPININGEKELEDCYLRIAQLPFRSIFSSPLLRCQVVAQKLQSVKHVPLLFDTRLKELSYGVFEGLTRKEIEKRFPALLHRWYKDPFSTEFPKGESFKQMIVRVRKMMKRVRPLQEPVLIIAHGGPLRVILCDALQVPLRFSRSFPFDNCSLSMIASPYSKPHLLLHNVYLKHQI